MSSPGTRHTASLEARILEALEQHGARVAELEALVVRLSARLGARERRRIDGLRATDEALVLLVADEIGSRPFTARGVLTLARLDPATPLAHALAGADATDARTLGWLLRRVTDRPVGGVVVTRHGASRDGALWRVVRAE